MYKIEKNITHWKMFQLQIFNETLAIRFSNINQIINILEVDNNENYKNNIFNKIR